MNPFAFLEERYFGNPLREYLVVLGIILFGFLLKRLVALVISRQTFRFFKKFAANQYSEEFVALLRKPFEQLLTVLILYIAFDRLDFPISWHLGPQEKFGVRWVIQAVFETALIVVVTRVLMRSIDFMEIVYERSHDERVNFDLVRFLKELAKIVLVIMAFFTILAEAFKVNITAVVASLGIGGLAVALAAQDTIANLFGSFIIYLDRPFQVGDLVETGDVKGTVEKIGFRTTRLRTLDKSLLTVPNKKMVDAALNNITQSVQKRVVTNLALSYESKLTDLKKILAEIKQAIIDHPHTVGENFVSLSDFNNNSINLQVIYYVDIADADRTIEVKEAINIRIMEIIEANHTRFAVPMQTVVVGKA